MNTDNWITAVLALRKATKIVVFTGAGISAESGIPTFRDNDGFWQRFPPEQFATWSGLLTTAMTNPRLVVEFILNVVEPIAAAEANPGHIAVAQLESHAKTTVVTQNIDGLHHAAGSTNVLEIHGSLMEIVDTSTGHTVHKFEREELAAIAKSLRDFSSGTSSVLSLAGALRHQYPFDWLGRHRPNLVLFGDQLAHPAWDNACESADECNVLLTIGTSGAVYPAALLPDRAARCGATVISIDPQPTDGCWLQGLASTIVPKLIDDAFHGR